jgi:spore coat polysaccharide biosynthesis protein SpsF (cytidylyltransferase family)
MVRDKIITAIMQELADEYKLTLAEIEAVYESQWDFMVDTVEDIDFDTVTEEDFKSLKTNFNIPTLGKFYTTFNKVKNVRRKSRELREKQDSSGDDVQSNSSDGGEEEISI